MRALLGALLALSCSPPESRLPDPSQVALARLDRDGSGRVTVEELRDPRAEELLRRHDTDQSGDLDAAELAVALAAAPVGLGTEAPEGASQAPAPPPQRRTHPHVKGQRKKRAPRHRDP